MKHQLEGVKVGDTLYITGRASPRLARVERVTATHAVVSKYERYRIKDGERVGEYDRFFFCDASLATPQQIQDVVMRRRLEAAATRLARVPVNDDTVAAVEAFLESLKEKV